MEKTMITLKTCEYKTETEKYWGRADDWKLVTATDGVEVWCENRINKDRWYHAVCEDEAVGRKVLFDVARKEEFRVGLPCSMLDKLTELMQNELRPSGNHFVQVTCGFDSFGIGGKFTVNESNACAIPVFIGDFECKFNESDEWVKATCRYNDVEKAKPILLEKLMGSIEDKIGKKRKEIALLESKLESLEEFKKASEAKEN